MTGPATGARVLGALSAATGTALVARPHQVGELVAGGSGVPAPWIVRVLGARMVVQGVAQIARPGTPVLVVGAVTDALHSASMVWLERADRTYRRAARISAVVAGGNALANLLVLRSRR